MKAMVVREHICDSMLDALHGQFRDIKRLVIKTSIVSQSIRPGTLPLTSVNEVYIAVTPDGNQLYVYRFDFEQEPQDFQILGEIEINDKLAHEITEFLIAQETFRERRAEIEKLLAAVK